MSQTYFLPALLFAFLFGTLSASEAHPPPRPEEVSSTSEMLQRRPKPYRPSDGTIVEDKQARGRELFLDVQEIRLNNSDPLEVQITTWGASVPEPGGVLVYLVRKGQRSPGWVIYQPEPEEEGVEQPWGMFTLGRNGVYDDRVGDASFEQDGAVMTVRAALPSGLPRRGLLTFVRTRSGNDPENLWTDDAPNGRRGLVVR